MVSSQLTEEELLNQFKVETVMLGQGGFAEVRKLTRKIDAKTFALKTNKQGKESSEYMQALQTEINVLKHLEHPSIIKMEHFTYTKETFFLVSTFAMCVCVCVCVYLCLFMFVYVCLNLLVRVCVLQNKERIVQIFTAFGYIL